MNSQYVCVWTIIIKFIFAALFLILAGAEIQFGSLRQPSFSAKQICVKLNSKLFLETVMVGKKKKDILNTHASVRLTIDFQGYSYKFLSGENADSGLILTYAWSISISASSGLLFNFNQYVYHIGFALFIHNRASAARGLHSPLGGSRRHAKKDLWIGQIMFGISNSQSLNSGHPRSLSIDSELFLHS